MTEQLQTVAEHLLIVGGRAVRVAPPGALADPTLRRVARARDGDHFFILVTPDGEVRAAAAFFEQMAQLAAETYFNSGGGVTGGLREALSAIHEAVHTREDGQPVSALALVRRDAELYAARSGPIFAALRGGAGLITLPRDRSDSLAMNVPPLGLEDNPDIQLSRFDVTSGLTIMIANDGLLDASDAELRAALAQHSLADVIDHLKAVAAAETSASVIRFDTDTQHAAIVPPVTQPAEPEPEPDSAPAAEMPPSVEEAAPAVAAETASVVEAHKPPAVLPGDATEPALPIDPAPIVPLTDEETGETAPISESPAPPFSTEWDAEAAAEDTPSPAEEDADSLGRARDLLGGVTDRVRGAAQSSREHAPSTLEGASLSAKRLLRDALKAILSGFLALINGLQAAFNRLIPAPEEGRPGIPTNVAVGMAILIPLVITVAVVGLALSRQGKTEFETYLEQARTGHTQAIQLSGESCDNLTLRPLWEDVLRLANEALTLRENDVEVIQIRADARNYLDCYDGIQRRNVQVLHEFDEDAQLAGPIVQSSIEIYTLDRTSGTVYRDTLNEDGDGLTARADTPIFRGQAVSGYVVGDLYDIEFLTSGGTVHDNVLIAVDRDGLLVSYSPTFFASAQQLIVEGRWSDPKAIAVFRGNLYVLDAGASQIWRYVAPAGERRYSNAPDEYFIGENRPDLSNAVDLGISDTGEIFILFADGTVTKYRSGEPQAFAYSSRPDGALLGGTAIFVDNDPLASSLLIVDASSDSIYETLWGGKFQRAFQPVSTSADAFDDLTGVYADSVVRNNIYALSGNKLYVFKRNQ